MAGATYVGKQFTFVGRNNTSYTSTCAGEQVVPGTDIAILAFANPPPVTQVDRVKLLPGSAMAKMPQMTILGADASSCAANRTPAISVNQTSIRSSRVMDLYYLRADAPWVYYKTEFDGMQPSLSFPDWDATLIGGDCGHPIWFLINGELVYAATFYYGGAGPWAGGIPTTVNTEMQTLANRVSLPYEPVTLADLSAFPDLN